MKRSIYKLPYIANTFFKKRTERINNNLTLYRSSNIPAYFVNKKVSIYNGAWLLTNKIEEAMMGLKLGEFFQTKRFDRQSKTKSRGKRKVKK